MALIHFYFKEEPNTMDRFAILYNRLMFALKFKGEIQENKINVG